MKPENEFPRLKSVRVLVEERKVTLEMNQDTWRTYEFTGIETVPEKLRPAFIEGDGSALELNLLDLVRKSYQSGRAENRFEAPYRLTDGTKSATVLRSILVTCQYRRTANAGAALRRQPRMVTMPMVQDGVWARFETDRVEAELRRKFPKLSTNVISLVVRLTKLDLRPREGTARLKKLAEALIEGRRIKV